jgi:HAD superfamily hydrolase (TIGR01459 family)
VTIPFIPQIRSLAERYDGFILDLWGVIHDGSTAYPGAVNGLRHLMAAGRRVVLLSNSPRRAYSLEGMMTQMGIARSDYHIIVSSGEATHRELLLRTDPWFAKLGRRSYHLGPPRDQHLFDGLDLDRVETLAEADFVLNTGPDEITDTLDMYVPALDEALRRKLPMICANPDLVVMHKGHEMICAGVLAVYYSERGGDVVYRGKPHREIYDLCFAEMEGISKDRIVAIGDAFHTDMQGAATAGIDAVLCSGGIHAAELNTDYGQPPSLEKLERLAARYPHCHPVGVIAGLIW